MVVGTMLLEVNAEAGIDGEDGACDVEGSVSLVTGGGDD